MQSHELKKPKQTRKQRVGRGGKRGTYSGRGVKGQKARAGARIRPEIWDYITRTPKLKGPVKKGSGSQDKMRPIGKSPDVLIKAVNLDNLNKHIKTGDTVNVEFLIKNNLVEKYKGRNPKVKLLARGDIDKKITVEGIEVSKSVREKIEKVGGTVK
ncbi:MAG: uL15 family ribosomal protein [Candidatus Spechtbacterales bacterium]